MLSGFLIPQTILQAQTPTEPCGFGVVMEMMQQHPLGEGYQDRLQKFEEKYTQLKSCENNTPYLIPVVFHVMHNNGPENISEAQIDDALAQMNLQFAGGEGGFNTQIQFTRARIDPDGNCTSGINRILTSTPDAIYDDPYSDIALKNLSRWPTDRYVNIWIVRCILPDLDCSDNFGTLGYAFRPPYIPEQDGLVVVHRALGTVGTAAGNTVNTLTHEMGHYLSLYHVWGPDGANCAQECHAAADCMTLGDRVCDTQACSGALQTTDCSAYQTLCNVSCPGSPVTSGVYPKENYMSYVHTCQDQFTECQSARMKFALENYREKLWNEGNLTCTGIGGFLGNDIVITQNTSWTTANLPNGGNITITGSLTIQPHASTPNTPVTLSIGPGVTVHFCQNGKAVVKPNATLDLSGTLTSSCMGQWKGIEVWGDNTKSQYDQSGRRWQGRLYGRNGAIIEHTETGAQLWGPDYYLNAGGQIFCTGTTFKNNIRSVEFAPYENFWPFSVPSGWLNDVKDYYGSFTQCTFVTNDDYLGTQPFNAFLHMTGVRGVPISGSTFTNSRTISSSNFADWGYGIFAMDAGFNLTATPVGITYPPSSYITSAFTNLGYGIYTSNSTASKPYTVRQSDFNGCFVGVYNRGVSAGVTILNTFNLGQVPSSTIIPITPLGSPSQQDQVGVIFENAISGFTFEENDFQKVSGNVNNTIGSICKNIGGYNNVVRKNRYQGLSHANVSNEVNATTYGVISRGLNYLCNENTDITSHDFLVTDGRIRNRQGIEIAVLNPGQPTTFTYNASGNRFSYLAGSNLSDFYNAGTPLTYYHDPTKPNQEPLDFSAFITKVISSNNNCTTTYCAPPCKTITEIEQIKGDYYHYRERRDILTADYEINPTPQKAEGITFYQARMDAAAYMVVLHVIRDTLDFSPDTLRRWIGNMNSLESDLWLASDYIRIGESSKAMQLLDAAPDKYNLDTEAQNAASEFKSVLELLAGQQIYDLDGPTLESLEGYAALEDYAGGLAQNILTWYGLHYPPAYTLYSFEERNNDRKNQKILPGKSVMIIPNPTAGPISLQYALPTSFQNIFLRILDVNGSLVQTFNSLKSDGKIAIDFSSPGMYFYQLIADGSLVESGKILVQR